ncbi:disease resistance protein RPV1-like [Syzygium oleosum]|uniref:disease resistance protein RPV1-like n=1 Tax=Syzygium oleosum TaxID=219896 RepID=UPI0024B9CCBC|nr:disease resistance protein RPV1-like [Syzygium oleosum]
MAVSSGFDYEVFLSFRGPDTRADFTDFLYISLIDAGIRACRDDKDLRVGDGIGLELLHAIKQSRISIPIFSKQYASSTWCLMELVQMVECKKNMGQRIMPNFYDVDPSEVQYQTGGYGQAFLEHESKRRYDNGTISERKVALSEVGALKGWDLQSIPNRHEGHSVKTVVKKVFSELKKGCLALSDCLVEVNNHNQLIFDILKRKWKDISNTDEGIEMIEERLCGKRLLLLLDDVDEKNRLNALMGHNWFGEGSKVIVTSRNKQVLNVSEVDWTYELKCMDFDKSLQLFSKHAFRRDRPLEDHLTRSRKAVGIAGGLPLALEIIGSLLSCNSTEKWDAILTKLEKVPHEEVSSKLKISYEALDDQQQQIFLDIACFFIGYDKEIAIHMWDETKIFPEEALEVLQHMSLIKIKENNTLWMHDLTRDLGREIIRQHSNMVTEKQTGVWDADEALDLLMTNREKEKVEALHLELHHPAEHRFADEELMRLPNLRFLVVIGDKSKWFRDLLGPMAKSLKVLDMSGCFFLVKTPDFSGLANLERLIMEGCIRLARVDESVGQLQRLVFLDVRYCVCLRDLPNEIHKLKSLKELLIEGTQIQDNMSSSRSE